MKKPPADPKSCASCEPYKPVDPGDDAGYCHLMPPTWANDEWSRPVVACTDACRFWLQKLNS